MKLMTYRKSQQGFTAQESIDHIPLNQMPKPRTKPPSLLKGSSTLYITNDNIYKKLHLQVVTSLLESNLSINPKIDKICDLSQEIWKSFLKMLYQSFISGIDSIIVLSL